VNAADRFVIVHPDRQRLVGRSVLGLFWTDDVSEALHFGSIDKARALRRDIHEPCSIYQGWGTDTETQILSEGTPKELIGSDVDHTIWCRQIARRSIRDAKRKLGPAWEMLGPDVREAFVARELTSVILGQENLEAPLWRMVELLHVAHRSLEEDGK